jgi:hypothetical protein
MTLDTGTIAVALAVIGVAQLLLVAVYWHTTHDLARRFPHLMSLAIIGSAMSIFGALCFAIAFLLGD